MARKKNTGAKATTPKTEKPAAAPSQPPSGGVRICTLNVFIASGPVSQKFLKKNPEMSRTIEIRGDQTLADLHDTIFSAFDRFDEHLYEFQFGKAPMDPGNKRYVLSEDGDDGDRPPAGFVESTTINSLGLKVGDRFGYWFDFGDDWWHQINVEAIEEKAPEGTYPKVTKRVGKSPPQYSDSDD